MKKVLVSTALPPEGFTELKEKFEVTIPDKGMFSKEEILNIIDGFDAFLPTFQFKVNKDILDIAAKRVKIIANFGVGYDNIDVDYAAKCGIVVTNTPDPVVEPTAEQAVALMLAAARRVGECDRKMRTAGGLKWGVMENLGISLSGKTLGIIGMGNIGQTVARRCMALGMRIVYHNRNRLSHEKELACGAKWLSLDELLQVSDVISLHAPSTSETKHMINAQTLGLMKQSAILINTARGALVDETALITALKNGRIFAAGLDVFEHEPEVNKDFFELHNVVLAPHNGTATIDARIDMSRFASRNIIRFFEGRDDITRVN